MQNRNKDGADRKSEKNPKLFQSVLNELTCLCLNKFRLVFDEQVLIIG